MDENKISKHEFGMIFQKYAFHKIPYDVSDEDYKTSYNPKNTFRIFQTKNDPPSLTEFKETLKKMKKKNFILENPSKIIYQAIPFEFRKEKDFVLKILSLTEETGFFYVFLPLSIRSDSDICLNALKHLNLSNNSFGFEKKFIEFIPKELKEKKEIFEAIADSNLEGSILSYFPSKLQTIENVLKFLKKYPKDFSFVDEEIKKQKEIVLFMLSTKYDDLNPFDSVDIKLKKDFNFVKQAVNLNQKIYPKIEEKFKKNVEIIEIALNYHQNIEFIPSEYFYQNKENVLNFLKKYPYACKYLPIKLEEDFDFLKKISTSNWVYLKSTSIKTILKINEKSIIEEIEKNLNFFKECKPLHEYPNIIEIARKYDKTVISSLEEIPKEKLFEYLKEDSELIDILNDKVKSFYKNDEDFKMIQIKENPTKFKEIGIGITDREILKKYLKISGICINWMSDEIKEDKEMVLIALNYSGDSIEFINPYLRRDKKIMLTACRNFGRGLQYASDKLKDDFELVKIAIENNGTAIKFASKRLKLNVELCLIAVRQTRIAYRDLDPSMQSQFDIWLLYSKKHEKLRPNKLEKLKDVKFNFL